MKSLIIMVVLYAGIVFAEPSKTSDPLIERALKDYPPGATDLVREKKPGSDHSFGGLITTETESVSELSQLTTICLIGTVTRKEGSKTIASGSASATIQKERFRKTSIPGQNAATKVEKSSEDMQISASEIVFDSEANALACFGIVEIKTAGRAIKGKDLRIEFGKESTACIILSEPKQTGSSNEPNRRTEPSSPRRAGSP